MKNHIIQCLDEDMLRHYKKVDAEKKLAYNITKKNAFINPLPVKTK